MKTTVAVLSLAACLLSACGKNNPPATTSTETTNPSTTGNPLTAPVDYLGAVGQAQKHAVKIVDLVQVQQAIRQFQAAENRFPTDLNELIKEGYLAALPKLPANMKYEYAAKTGQVKAVAKP